MADRMKRSVRLVPTRIRLSGIKTDNPLPSLTTPVDTVEHQLLLCIITCLKSMIDNCTPENRELLEVAIRGVEVAFNLEIGEEHVVDQINLVTLFRSAVETEYNRKRAEELKNRGDRYMRNCQYSDAIDMYTGARMFDLTNATYYYNLAAAHHAIGNRRNAIADWKRGWDLDPQFSKSHRRLGEILLSKHDRPEDMPQMMPEPSTSAPEHNRINLEKEAEEDARILTQIERFRRQFKRSGGEGHAADEAGPSSSWSDSEEDD